MANDESITGALNEGKGGELGVVIEMEGKVWSRRGGTQARIRLHVHDQDA